LVVLIKAGRLAGGPNLEVGAVKVHLVFAKLDEKMVLGGGAVHLVSGERQAASHSRRPQVSVGRTHQPE
jgi:hypothetical protein